MPNKSRNGKSRKSSRPTRAQLARRFRDRNRRFKALSPSKQRLKIISDVISLLETGRAVAKTDNAYLELDGRRKYFEEDSQLHEALDSNKCQVCGIGGLFMSAVTLKNKLKIKDLKEKNPSEINRWEMVDYLRKWFDIGQLTDIETAFEATGNVSTYGSMAARQFGRRFRNDKKRLIAICYNMLENDGKFVPPPYESQE